MAISSETRTAGPYTGNGSQTVFAFSFKIFSAADLTGGVILTDDDGVETTQVLNTHYTVSLNADQDTAPGGSITMVTAPPTDYLLTLTSNVGNLQQTTITNNGGFFPAVINAALDKLTILVQQLLNRVNRSIKIPLSDGTAVTTQLPTKTLRANKTLGFDNNGNVVVGDVSTTIVSSAMTSVVQAASYAAALTTLGFSAFFQTLIGATNAAALLTTLGFSAFIQTLIGSANAAAARSTLGAAASGANADITSMTALASVNGGALAGNRNAIINGAMDIWQRGTSFAAAANGQYSADRWIYSKSGAMVHTLSRSTDVPTVSQAGRLFNYSLLVDCTTVDSSIAAGDFAIVAQKIEGFNWAAFAQRALTLSFWVKATKTGTYCISVVNGGSDRSYVGTYTVNAADTWEYKTVSVTASPSAGTWNYDTGLGATVHFTLAAGSTYQATAGSWQTGNFLATSAQVNACDSTSNDFRIVGVQLENGAVATPFEHRAFANELAMCQRYYEKSYPYATAPGAAEATYYQNLGFALNNTFFYDAGKVFFKVLKRLSPVAVSVFSTDGTANTIRDLNAAANVGSVGIGQNSEQGFVVASSGASFTANNLYACHWTASSEL